MKITFFIGNGYDINIGLKTGYPDFLKWYVAQSSENDLIADFKHVIRENIEYWSDLEIALGQKTLTYPLNTKRSFAKCKYDLDTHMQKYLTAQNKLVQSPSPKDIEIFRQSIVKFPLCCSNGYLSDLKAIYNSHGSEEYEYNIIDFNFTDTVDIFWNKLSGNDFWHQIHYPRLLNGQSFLTIDKKGKLIHIHGTLKNAMMTGVGDSSQLANTIFRRTDLITSLCVKPIMNENCRNEIEENVSKIISNTDIFVVYGMSIGVTDAKWWKRVVKRLLTENNSYLVIINYDKDYNPALPYTSSLVARKIIGNLIDSSECPPEYHARLKNRIAVLLNTNLFKFTSLLKGECFTTDSIPNDDNMRLEKQETNTFPKASDLLAQEVLTNVDTFRKKSPQFSPAKE